MELWTINAADCVTGEVIMQTDATLEELIGRVALGEYNAAPEYAKPKLLAWARKLRDLSEFDFRMETQMAIHGSALMNSFRGNHEDVHCQASACFHESRRRHVAAGHSEDCRGDSIYVEAFRSVWRSQGHSASAYPPAKCTCTDNLDEDD